MTSGAFESTLEISGYSCEGLIGRGGMGSVYRAIQLSHRRPVALKILGEAFRDDPAFVACFRREAELLAELEHPHIVPLLDSGEAEGVPYIVMRLIDGPNLRDVIRLGALSPVDSVAMLGDVAEALDFAHAHGVLHRDVKPHNMLLDHGGHVWLADFGLTSPPGVGVPAAGTGGLVSGTRDYLAPELLTGQPASVASDIYALGVSAFQLLTGRLPFSGEVEPDGGGGSAVTRAAPAAALMPELARTVDPVLGDAMAVEPSARPASAGAFVSALGDAFGVPSRRGRIGSLVVATPRPSGGGQAESGTRSVLTDARTASPRESRRIGRSPRWTRGRRRTRWLAGLGAAVVAAVGVVVVLLASPSAPVARAAVVLHTGERPVTPRFDPVSDGGLAGNVLAPHSSVEVTCRLPGRRIDDDSWWYRLATQDEQFSASATDFPESSGSAAHGYDPAVPVCRGVPLVAGNPGGSATWSDYRRGGGTPGSLVSGFRAVEVACRVQGAVVADGNRWWYRLAAAPWRGRFYVSADAFYNNGETRGGLHGTPFVDTMVPLCSASAPETT